MRLDRSILSLLIIGFVTAGAPHAVADESGDEGEDKGGNKELAVQFTWGVKIPMRDGVNLVGALYEPASDGPFSTLFAMTPYNFDSYHLFAKEMAENGFAFLALDGRGRGNSEGEFHPFLQDAKDGYDVVEWIARQDWSNGKVAMFGGSYNGSTQWATAKEFPPHLTTIIPTASAFVGIDFPAVNNIFRTYAMQWLTFVSGKPTNMNTFIDPEFWAPLYGDLHQGKVTFKDFDAYIGNPSRIYQRWLEHPSIDDYWDSIVPTEEQFARLEIPVLTVTGAYDADQPGAMQFYRNHMQLGSPTGKENHYLVMGPWDHAGTRSPQQIVGGVDVGLASVIDINGLNRDWYDWHMNDGEKPAFLQDRIAYYVVGSNQWKYAATLEDIGSRKMRLYLDSAGVASPTVFDSGVLTPEPPDVTQTSYYVDDPLDTERVIEREVNTTIDPSTGWLYQDNVLALDDDGLVYHTAPFTEATEIAGYATLELWLSMDVPDTDISVTISEILPNGKSIMLSGDMMRARYRKSLRQAELVTPGTIEKYVFDKFLFFARQIGKGSRLRLVISGNNTIAWQQNYNSGGVVAEETPADARTATVTLHQDRQHRSVLVLPLDE